MGDEFEDVLTAVGPRLRALRVAAGTTLNQLSETTGISVSTLSRLESGLRKPTLELMLPLAKAYGVPLDELVGAPETGDPRVHLRPVKRNGRTIIPLTRRLGGIQAYKMIIPQEAIGELRVHEGYDWLYVMSGRLRLMLADKEVVLTPGEAAEFDTHVPHAFTSADPQPVEVLTLFGSQGERMHVRARPATSS